MSRRKAALPPEYEPPRRPSRSQQRGVVPAVVLATSSQQGQPLGQPGATAAAAPFQPLLGNDERQLDTGAAVLGSVLCQSGASGQQVWRSRCLYACVPPLHCAPVMDMAAGLHPKYIAGIRKAAQVVHVLAGSAEHHEETGKRGCCRQGAQQLRQGVQAPPVLCLRRAPGMQPQQPGCSAQSYEVLARSASALHMLVKAQVPMQTQTSTSQRQLASHCGQRRRLPNVSADFSIVKGQLLVL